MARKTNSDSGEPPGGKPVRTLAAEIKQLEGQLVELLQQHAAKLLEIQECSQQTAKKHLDRLQTSRRDQLGKSVKGPLSQTTLGAVLRELIFAEQCLLEPQRVAYLGPPHSYSHLATIEKFGSSAELVPVGSIPAVFEEVAQGHAQQGVVPIENSSDGRIVDTLEMFTKSSVQICGQVPLPIHHNLLGIGPRDGIREICSKPQAISQCRDWLANHIPHAKLVPSSSTTAAAERAANDPAVAAIASRQAGVQYGLKVLAKNIEDKKDNITRFAIIGHHRAERTGNDKTSIMFELSHEPGALADAMQIFKRKDLNMTWIESFPKPDSPSEYFFFVEFVGYPTDVRVKRALTLLEKKTVRLEVLGAYGMES